MIPSRKELEQIAKEMKERKEPVMMNIKFKHLHYVIEVNGEDLKEITEKITEIKEKMR